MNCLVTIQHPAHVHFYRPVIDALERAGHEVSVYVREKDVATRLLSAFDVSHAVLAESAGSLAGLAAVQARYEYRLLRAARRERPDVITGIGGVAAAHVGAVTGATSVVFTDTEAWANFVAAPFADVVCTPRSFDQEFGARHVRYDGYQELAYLHPDRFEPDPGVLREYGVDPDEPYSVLRFGEMAAHHDVGEAGLSRSAKRELLSALGDHGPVYVSVEGDAPGTVDHEFPVPPHLVHQLLYHADVFVTDASTMATEAGVLGTPTVRSNSFVGDDDMSNFRELESEYGLVRSTPDEQEAVSLATEYLGDDAAARRWRRGRADLLADTVDVAGFAAAVLRAAGDPDCHPADAGEGVARA